MQIRVFDRCHFSYAATKQGKKSSYSKFVKEEIFLKNSQWEKTFPNLVSTEAFQLCLYPVNAYMKANNGF